MHDGLKDISASTRLLLAIAERATVAEISGLCRTAHSIVGRDELLCGLCAAYEERRTEPVTLDTVARCSGCDRELPAGVEAVDLDAWQDGRVSLGARSRHGGVA